MDTRAPRVPSIVGSFSQPPSQEFVADSVAPLVGPLVLAAARASPAALREGAQSDNRRATTPDEPTAVATAEQWPRSVLRALPPRVGRSDSPAQ